MKTIIKAITDMCARGTSLLSLYGSGRGWVCACIAFSLTSCSDYLDTNSVSKADGDFVFSNMVTARAAMDGAYSQWHSVIGSHVFGDGLFYALDIAGSDIMRHPEKYANQLPRHVPESFYTNGTEAATYDATSYGKEAPNSPYSNLFSTLGKTNAVTTAIEGKADFEAMISEGKPTEMSQLYGEAVCLRASVYRELIKYYGDVPFQTVMGQPAKGLAPRDSIYEVVIRELQRVAPLMNPVGKANKNYFSRTYAYALIGRLALEAAGYQTRRGDIKYVDGEGNALTFETIGTPNNGATYGRRSDYKKLYQIAKQAYEDCMANLGACAFCPEYQDFFNEMHASDTDYATESISEEPYNQGNNSDSRPYSFGRPSSGGSSKAYPCKNYGQGRVNPAFYYGVFDPSDLRRDLSCGVTGSTGKGYETLIPFTPNSKSAGGGITCNKWDECRQATINVASQRNSGINAPYLRLSEVYLGYAEACAVLGDEATAKQYLAKIRNRAFGGNGNVEAFIQKEGSLFKAIIDERGFEFACEGDRRFTLIRSGLVAEKIRYIKELTRKMIDGLKTDGYYTFENGNTISNVVYTKMVDPKGELGMKSRLVGQCQDKTNPVCYPGWRGQANWEDYSGFTNYEKDPKSNLAIRGLFEHLSASQVAALEADGYKAQPWGSDIVKNETEYYDYLFYKYDYEKAPIYLFPFTPNAMATGGYTNGYGFANN